MAQRGTLQRERKTSSHHCVIYTKKSVNHKGQNMYVMQTLDKELISEVMNVK